MTKTADETTVGEFPKPVRIESAWMAADVQPASEGSLQRGVEELAEPRAPTAKSWIGKSASLLRAVIDRVAAGSKATSDGSSVCSWKPEGDGSDASGSNFVWSGRIGPGWARLRCDVMAPEGSAELFVDGTESLQQHCLLHLGEFRQELKVDQYVHLTKPVASARLTIAGRADEVAVRHFSLRRASRLGLYLRALARKFQQLHACGRLGPAFKAAWRYLRRGDFATLRARLASSFALNTQLTNAVSYNLWRKKRRLTAAGRQRIRQEISRMGALPTISVIVPVYNVPDRYLREMIDSVVNQIYPHWELLLVDDGSPSPHVRATMQEYADRDARIRVKFRETNGNISAASNIALEMANGEYIALLDHDDLLAEHALYEMARAIADDPTLDMLYSDEDKITPGGLHLDPFFKPDWSPEYLLGCMYTCHLSVYRTRLAREVGGFRSEFDGAQDYDLALRITSRTTRIRHLPDVLYHWRMLPTSTASGPAAKPNSHFVAARALRAWLDENGRKGEVAPGPSTGFHRVRFDILGSPRVSIVIPSASKRATIRGQDGYLLAACVQSIRNKSTWPNLEIIVVDNGDMPRPLADAMRDLNVKTISYTDKFNLSAKMNLGAQRAGGDHLLFLNDDIEVISPDWIECMLEFSQQAEIGAVGAKLFFPDGRLQHIGVTIQGTYPGHPWYGHEGSHPGYYFGNMVARNYSAVTGACVMSRAEVFWAVGGFDASFPLNYNDVDYCLRVVSRGKRVVFTPYAQLYHHESVSKSGTHPSELNAFVERWGEKWAEDPYFNPNLAVGASDYQIRV